MIKLQLKHRKQYIISVAEKTILQMLLRKAPSAQLEEAHLIEGFLNKPYKSTHQLEAESQRLIQTGEGGVRFTK